MAEMKRCAQCGLLKEATDFRQYTYSKYKGTAGRYRICRSCESINTKYKRAVALLERKPTCSTIDKEYAQWQHALEFVPKCEQLYETLISKGLHPVWNKAERAPRVQNDADIDSLLQFYEVNTPTAPPSTRISVEATDSLPNDLRQWLTCDTATWHENDLDPEYLQETIYESLKAKYRPQIGWDQQRSIPLYDDTYRDVLNQILRRFDDYEDEFNAGTTGQEEEV